MSEFEPPAPGWWQAADDNWYPPEEHPDYTAPPAASLPAPIAVPPTSPPRPADLALAQAANAVQAKPSRRKWWAIAVAAVLALLAAVGVASFGGTETEVTDDVAQTVVDDVSGDQEPDPEPPAETEPDREAPPAADSSPVGTRENPLAYDALVPIVFSVFGDADGSIWNVQVAPPRDITDAVMAENSFNEAPPQGVVFVGFDVEMTLASAGKEPLSPGFNFSWELLGGTTAAVYDLATIDGVFGCGVAPNSFNQFAEVFVGGTVSGTACVPLPAEDLESPDTFVAMNIAGDRQVFATNGARPDPVEVVRGSAVPSGTTLGYEAQVPVVFSTSGDADQSVWNITVSPPRDVGPAVLEANQLNAPPPDGATFVGFDVEMTLASAGKEPLSPGFNFTWEILGGATLAVYQSGTIDDLFGCGITADDFDRLAEVFVGGTLSGLVCIPIPTEDLGHPDTQVAMDFSGDRIRFSDDGLTSAPADLEPGTGVAGTGTPLPLDAAVDLSWDTLGDADRSTWSTTITNWRDMTAEVLAENSFNEPPPEGVVFVGFDAEMTLIEAEEEPLSVAFNFSWEILGSTTNRVYREGTIGALVGCGVVPSEFDNFAEVFTGGTLSGTVCIPLPASDFADPDTRIAMNFSGDRVTFAPDQ